jgi:hypothetical protein
VQKFGVYGALLSGAAGLLKGRRVACRPRRRSPRLERRRYVRAIDPYRTLREASRRGLRGQKPPLEVKEIWAIRIRLQLEERIRDLAMFNLAIDSKLRACRAAGPVRNHRDPPSRCGGLGRLAEGLRGGDCGRPSSPVRSISRPAGSIRAARSPPERLPAKSQLLFRGQCRRSRFSAVLSSASNRALVANHGICEFSAAPLRTRTPTRRFISLTESH